MEKEINIAGKLSGNKVYRFVQKNGFYILYIIWFLIEIYINCSTAGQKVPYSVYISIQRIPKYALFLYIILFSNTLYANC